MTFSDSLRTGKYVVAALLTLTLAGALIGFTWFATNRIVAAQERETIERANTIVAGLSATYAEQLNRHVLALDQSLDVMVKEWESDPRRFNLEVWRARATVLAGISRDMFLTDENGTIRQASVPEFIGQSIADLEVFRDAAEHANDKPKLYVGPPGINPIMRQWHLDVARTLHNPDGSFAGIIAADYRLSAITDVFGAASPGPNGFAAFFSLGDGKLRGTLGSGTAAQDANISDTPMFAAVDSEGATTGGAKGGAGLWVGPSAADAVPRIHAFRRLPGRDLAVIAGLDQREVLRPVVTWAWQARLFAGGITALGTIITVLVASELYHARRRAARAREDQAQLAAAHALAEVSRAHADVAFQQLHATFATVADGVAIFDAQLNLVEWNTLFPERSGVNASFIRIGLPMEDVLRIQAQAGYFGETEDVPQEVERRTALFRAGNFGDSQCFLAEGRVIELRCRPLTEGGFVALYTDITEGRIARHALHEANAALEHEKSSRARFLGVIGHELRARVTALLQVIGWLQANESSPSQSEALDRVRRAGETLASLATDTVEVPQMEAGALRLQPAMLKVRPLLEDSIATFQPVAAEHGITVHLIVNETAPEELIADAGRIRQILTLLLSEAIRFATPASMWVLVGPEEDTRANEASLHLTIRAFGPAIPEAVRVQMFPGLDEIVPPGGGRADGTGLDLAIARHLITLMGGQARCETWSAANEATGNEATGNDFLMILPPGLLPGRSVRPPGHGRGHAAGEGRPLPRTRVLLIGAPTGLQMATATILRRAGHMVDAAVTGANAVRALNRAPYDIVFIDSALSDMTVEIAAKYIRYLPGPARTVPIAVLAETHTDEEAETWRAAGVDDILISPPTLRDLVDSIGHHVWLGSGTASAAAITAAEEGPGEEGIPILAAARIIELRSNIPGEQLVDMVEECIGDLVNRMPALRRSLAASAPGAIAAQAHAMVGLAGGYGMAVLEARLRAILNAVRDKRLDTIDGAAVMIEADIARAAAALRRAVRQGEPAQ